MLIQTIDIEAVVSDLETYPFTRLSEKDANRLIDAFIITAIRTYGLPLVGCWANFKTQKEYEWYLDNVDAHKNFYRTLTPVIRFNPMGSEFKIYRINNALFLISE